MGKIYMISDATGEAFETSNPEWHKESRRVNYKEFAVAREKYLRKQLLKHIKPNTTVYTTVSNVSKSGMSRHIGVYIVTKDKKIWNISMMVAELCGYGKRDGALQISGCGMDMGFAVVYSLGHKLWPNGTKKPHGTRNGEPDSAGGYALKHSWL